MSSPSIFRSAGSGAVVGMAAWLAYGVAETFFVTIAPRIVGSPIEFRYLHFDFARQILAIYALIGAGAGAALGAVTRVGPGRLRAAALATVSLAFATNLVAQLLSRPSALPFSIAALAGALGVVLIFAATGDARLGRLRFLASPAVVSLLLTAPPWITKDVLKTHHGTATRAGAALGLCAGVIVLSYVLHRLLRKDGAVRPLRSFLVTVLAAAAVLLVGRAWNGVPAAGDASTPVVLIVLDTVRADHLSLQGYERDTSPNLERFAEDAVVYTHAIAPGDMTLSTHASLFTGAYAREHGAHHPDPGSPAGSGPPPALPERFETLAETLDANGYRSYGVVANHGYLAPFFRLDQGFDYWDSRAAPGWTSARYLLRNGIRGLLDGTSRSPQESRRAFRSADDIHREVAALLGRIGRSPRGIFLFVNYMDAHFPYVPPPPFDRMFPGFDRALTVDRLERRRRQVILHGGDLTGAETDHLVSQYDGGIAYVDSRVGMLMDRLKAAGLYDDALIVVTSDHGEAFGERGLMDHGVSVYGNQVHVPLLIKVPGATDGGRRVERTVSLVDVLPTVLTQLRIPLPDGVRGAAILPRGEPGREPVVSEHFPAEMFVKSGAPSAEVQRAIHDGAWKLLRTAGGVTELYDVGADPGETADLRSEHPAEAARLVERLDSWLESTAEAEAGEGVADDDATERLKALGYVQ